MKKLKKENILRVKQCENFLWFGLYTIWNNSGYKSALFMFED